MKYRNLPVLLLLLALGAAGSLNALMVELPPQELAARADVIVTGTVTNVTSQWDDSHSLIYSDVAVSVERFDKGAASNRLTVRVPGGEVGDVGLAVEDQPVFAPGQRVSMYLRQTPDRAVFKLAHGGQGVALGGKPPREYYYKYSGYHRNPANCVYQINSGLPDGWNAVLQAAAGTWTAVRSGFTFTYGGPTTARGPAYDGVNVICDSNMGVGGGVLAANYYWYNRRKIVFENDIVFNTDFDWSTEGATGFYDVQNIGTHELGHSLVLDDLYKSYQSEMTMYGYGAKGETDKRTLEFGDVDGINFIYP